MAQEGKESEQTAAEMLSKTPHRRYNPLTRQWVLVSPQRTDRPWQGEVSPRSPRPEIHYDPKCYLCPGNARAGGKLNPTYKSVFVFENDYPALTSSSSVQAGVRRTGLLVAEPETGRCLVMCFHPDHSLTLARMNAPDIVTVVSMWKEQTLAIVADPKIAYTQIFENRGAIMGASNPHPHCQMWATEHVPDEPLAETDAQREYLREHGSCLLCDYRKQEEQGARIVCENEHFVALVPFWAVWPFETMVLSKRHLTGFPDFSSDEIVGLADILKQLTVRYDNLFEIDFPYTMGFHQAPCDDEQHPEWHFHGHFYPPLLRSAQIRKFMVGFEMLGMPQRDLTAETAAAKLRSLSPIHFSDDAGKVGEKG